MPKTKVKKAVVNNMLVKHNVKPIITPILRNHNKTILGLVHVITCNILGINPLTITALMPYATATSVYTSVAGNGSLTDKIDTTKQVSFDGKKLNAVIAKDANNCLLGTATDSTYKKFATSIKKLSNDTSVIADYFTYFCDYQKLDKKSSIAKARKTDYLKKSAFADTIKIALGNVKTA